VKFFNKAISVEWAPGVEMVFATWLNLWFIQKSPENFSSQSKNPEGIVLGYSKMVRDPWSNRI
jgi:hypothetical protein